MATMSKAKAKREDCFAASMAILDAVFPDMPVPRKVKCEQLVRLASVCRKGTKNCIVELGTYHGNGAIALCLGSECGMNIPILTIDDYQYKKGWSGEVYTNEDYLNFMTNIERAGVNPQHVRHRFHDCANLWKLPVELLFWDGGTTAEMLKHGILAWRRHVNIRGIIAIHDTMDGQFGAKELCEEYVTFGDYEDYKVLPGGIHTIRKKWQIYRDIT